VLLWSLGGVPRKELEVLVQQVSLQRQETGLLGQALQAERTALSRCQLENRALWARNQVSTRPRKHRARVFMYKTTLT